ncbi:hypothetical protein GN956_G24973 [Arapaima gigas]
MRFVQQDQNANEEDRWWTRANAIFCFGSGASLLEGCRLHHGIWQEPFMSAMSPAPPTVGWENGGDVGHPRGSQASLTSLSLLTTDYLLPVALSQVFRNVVILLRLLVLSHVKEPNDTDVFHRTG